MARKSKRNGARSTALARVKQTLERVEEPGILGVFKRLATDPKLTVDKLGELIRLQERILDREAVAAFDAAYKLMLPEIPRIKKRGQILNKEKQVQSRYSRYEDIRAVVDPILQRFGFTINFRTEWPETGVLEVVGELVHDRGGRRASRFRTTADASGGKNAIQGLGSGVQYGMRYTVKQLLAIVEEGVDDDGQAHGRQNASAADRPARPTGGAPAARVEPAGHHAAASEPITDKQRRRFYVLVTNSGRGDLEVKSWLEQRYGLTSSKQITRALYDEICAAVEAPGLLPPAR